MKKIAATILGLGLAISTLCACSSTGSGGEQPAKETTTKQTEAVTEAPTTEETTESEMTEPETTAGDEFIELFEPEGNFRGVNPDYLKSNFDTFVSHYELSRADIEADGHTLYELTFKGHNFDVSSQSGEIYNMDIYFFGNEIYNVTQIYYFINGKGTIMGADFIPLFYNQSKHCFVGYTYTTNDETGDFKAYDGLYEMYYVPEANEWVREPVADPSIYDFKN